MDDHRRSRRGADAAGTRGRRDAGVVHVRGADAILYSSRLSSGVSASQRGVRSHVGDGLHQHGDAGGWVYARDASNRDIRPSTPRALAGYAKFIRRYVESSGYHIRLTDKSGGEWFDASAKRGSRLVIRFRSHDGELQPLSGVARHMPDTLVLNMDAQAKLSFFTVGVSNLIGEFVHVHTASERGWAMRFTKEPRWQLPPLAEQLLHSPLQRPFVGDGVQFRIGYTRGTDGQTFLSRSVVLAVQESAIMRFLGTLGFTAMSDYAGQVEEEENRFLAEGFAALRADIASLTR